jgi:serine/threonine protein kinase
MALSEQRACGRCGAQVAAGALFCPMCGTAARRDGDPMIGEMVGDRYLLKDRLGHGGSGTIYLAEHVNLKRKVAVKILHHELSKDELAIERFRREATMVGEIDNEHIVEVLDFGRAGDGRLFLAMELLQGETLAQAIARQGRLTLPTVIDVMIQLGEALMEAHAMGYVHRDLRPGNVFLTRRRGREHFVKLLDFGLAKLVAPEGEAAATSLGMTFGDPRYMSPEQARGEIVDRRADIYSLGVIAYEMLTGQPPFVGKKVFDVLTQHLEAVPQPPSALRPDVPPWLDAIVVRALAKLPDDRFVTVYRLVEAVRQGLASGEIMSAEAAQTMPPVAPPPPAPRARVDEPSGPVAAPVVPPAPPAPAPAGDLEQEEEESAEAAPEPAPVEPTERVRSSRGQRAQAPAESSSGIWYASGEEPEASGAERSARVSETFVDDSAYAPPRRRQMLIFAGGAALVLLALGAILFWPHDKSAAPVAAVTPDASPPPPPPPPADAAVVAVVSPDASPPVRPTRPSHGSDDDDDDPGSSGPVVIIGGGTARPDAAPQTAAQTGDQAQADFFVKLGEKALREGDVVGAATSFNKAREFDARNPYAIAGLGQVAMQQGYYQEAVVHLEEATRLAPRSARLHILRGQAYLGLGDKDKAAEAFKEALKISPDNAEARKGYSEATGS